MSGIFPDNGVSASQAVNSVKKPDVEDGCTPRWYSPNCTPKFNAAAANAMIAEILNLLKCKGWTYDCDTLDNLCKALSVHTIAADVGIDVDSLPFAAINGTKTVRSGVITVPNTSIHNIYVNMTQTIAFRFQENVDGAQLFFNALVAPQDQPANVLRTVIRHQDFLLGPIADTHIQASFPSRTKVYLIPPGGRKFDYLMEITSDTANGWEIVNDAGANSMLVAVYGVSTDTQDTVLTIN